MHQKGIAPIIIIIAIVIIAGLGYWGYVSYTKAPPAPTATYKTGDRVTVEGVYVCLPHRDPTNLTKECAGGIRTSDGVSFGLSWKSFNPETDTPLPAGNYYRVEGVFTSAAPDSIYDAVGTIEIESVTEIRAQSPANSAEIGAYANVKAALDSGKSLKCVYTLNAGSNLYSQFQTYYIARGKVRTEAGSSQINTVTVIANGKVYAWNDLKAIPDVIVQPASGQIVTLINRTPLGQSECSEELIPDSLFGPPAGANIMEIGL